MTAELAWWPNLNAAWVDNHGWISTHPDTVNAYNRNNDFVGTFPDLGAATVALEDSRAQDWRSIPDLRDQHSLNRLTGRP